MKTPIAKVLKMGVFQNAGKCWKNQQIRRFSEFRSVVEAGLKWLNAVVNRHKESRIGDLDLLDFSAEFFQCAVTVDPVGDVIAERMTEHALPVRFGNSVGFTEA